MCALQNTLLDWELWMEKCWKHNQDRSVICAQSPLTIFLSLEEKTVNSWKGEKVWLENFRDNAFLPSCISYQISYQIKNPTTFLPAGIFWKAVAIYSFLQRIKFFSPILLSWIQQEKWNTILCYPLLTGVFWIVSFSSIYRALWEPWFVCFVIFFWKAYSSVKGEWTIQAQI